MSEKETKSFEEALKNRLHPEAPLPVTRRDFLAQGLVQFGVAVMTPSLLSYALAPREARAGECPPLGPALGLVPFLVFDMAGGGGLPANFLAGKAGGPEDLLAGYDQLGWDPRASGAIDKRFGLPMSANASKILAGILATTSPATQAKLRMGSYCHFSRDDTRANTVSAAVLVSRLGLRGSMIANGIGTVNTLSGGNSDAVVKDTLLKPLQVRAVSDISDSLNYGPALSRLRPKVIDALARAAMNMSAEQIQKFAALDGAQQLGQFTRCGYLTDLNFTAGVQGTDPRLEAVFQSVYNIKADSPGDSADAVSATVVMNVLKGQTGPGVITIGGCDYHDGTQATGDGKDLLTGREIGRAVEAAARMGKPLFFQLVTDGGVYAARGTRNWVGDAGDKSMTVVGYFDPAGAPSQRRLQVGAYTDGQGADRTTLVGPDSLRPGYGSFANYLAVCGKLGQFNDMVPNVFTQSQLESVLIFG